MIARRAGWSLAVMIFTLGACAGGSNDAASRRHVVAAFFPLAATIRGLVGSGVVVDDLTPPGVEPHDLELTTNQMDTILDARLRVVMGGGFQPAVEAAAARRPGPTVAVLDLPGLGGNDPHVWLDPVLMQRTVRLLAKEVGRAFPADRAAIGRREAALIRDLAALDSAYRNGLATCERRMIVTAHDAFGRLTQRYGLRSEPVTGISPEQEPDPRRLAALVALVDRVGVTTVFTERLVSPRVARTLAREAGVVTAVLDPIESAPPDGATVLRLPGGHAHQPASAPSGARLHRELKLSR